MRKYASILGTRNVPVIQPYLKTCRKIKKFQNLVIFKPWLLYLLFYLNSGMII